MGFVLNQKVKVAGIDEIGKIVKVQKSTVKVEFNGGTVKIFPFALVESVDDFANAEKPSPKKSRPNKSKKKSHTVTQDEQSDNNDSVDEKVSNKPENKKTSKFMLDDVSRYLSKFDTPAKLIAGAKKHPAYKHANKDAFKRAENVKNEIHFGLLRMRIGNMLRSASKKLNNS